MAFEASTVTHLSPNVSRDTNKGVKSGSHLLFIIQKQSSQEKREMTQRKRNTDREKIEHSV